MAEALVKKKLMLEGLDCANCAMKIEKGVGNIEGVNSCSVNFATKTMVLETVQNKESEVVTEAKQLVTKLEPHIKVQEEKNTKVAKEVFILEGLDCANCAMKIENKVKEMPTVSAATVDFVSKKLRVEVANKRELEATVANITNVVQKLEPDVKVVREEKGGHDHGHSHDHGEVFYQVGELFQSIAVNRSRKSITSLMDIRPDYANVKVGNETKQVSPEDVQIGDYIIVKPGEKVPLDGKVVEGASMVDTSALTGESVPREVEVGNDVLSGFVNQNGVLTIEVTKEFGESTVSKILDLVQNASSKKAPTENFITKFARYYTPVVVITAAIMAFIPPLILEGATFSDWIYRALVFLVISCPCALVVSIPLGFFGGIGGASKSGVLVKGSNYLEALNDVKYIVFDKTGTLTKGVFKVTKMEPSEGITNEELLEYAAFAEVYSNHPIAQSIRNAYRKSIDEKIIDDYNEISGHGTVVKVQGKEIFAGNAKLMRKENITFKQPETVGTLVHVAVDGKYAGYIVISDEVKEDSKQAIQKLKELGIKKTVMLTGDAKPVGEAVGKELGLDEVHAELLPQQKVEEIEKIDAAKHGKEKVAFVGDGINDTPVLARADVGIAMGGLGSDAAIEAADIVIMTDEPSKIATAVHIAKRTRRIVWQNIIFALGVKGLVLLLGAFGIATMWEAVFSDVGVTLLAVLNAMRVLRVKDL